MVKRKRRWVAPVLGVAVAGVVGSLIWKAWKGRPQYNVAVPGAEGQQSLNPSGADRPDPRRYGSTPTVVWHLDPWTGGEAAKGFEIPLEGMSKMALIELKTQVPDAADRVTQVYMSNENLGDPKLARSVYYIFLSTGSRHMERYRLWGERTLV